MLSAVVTKMVKFLGLWKHLFFEGRWIELPAMSTPRSLMSSVVVDQCVIVSGGQTDVHDITDTIILNPHWWA